jgi:translocation and assembly module TamB
MSSSTENKLAESVRQAARPVSRMRQRLRRFFLRHVPLAIGGAALLFVLSLLAAYFYASSAAFENLVRGRIAASIERMTGGRAEIASFHWRLLAMEAEAGGVVVHGREAAGEAPWASIGRLRVQVSVLNLFSPKFVLTSLEVERPRLHLIVYPDGSTNQPRPRQPKRAGRPIIDRLFDLKAGSVAVENGLIDYDNRAAGFDFQDRYAPLDFRAEDLSLRLSYIPAAKGAAESYRIEAGATDLNLARGAGKKADMPVHGRFQATADLTRNAFYLRRLLVSARGPGGKENGLAIAGALADFAHPRWQGTARGELDMRLLEPVTGYPFAPEGIAHLDLAASGDAQQFRIDGKVHVDGGAYVGTGVTARDVTLDARVHADERRLLIDGIVARFRRGGQMEGTVDLTDWLPPSRSVARMEAPGTARVAANAAARAEETIPVNGKVTAVLKNLPLDTLLGMVSEPPFQDLGIHTLLNGPAEATWMRGDDGTVKVSATLALNTPPAGAATPAGGVPANGAVDATYTQRDGSVDIRKLDLKLPASELQASGKLGAYPMTGASALAIDFRSQNLAEFDTVLRDLGLERGARAGAAALPVKLAGDGEFHGAWTGSLLRPAIAGAMKATSLSMEMPEPRAAGQQAAGSPKFVEFDLVEAAGSYSPARISIQHGTFERGAARLRISGTLDAALHPAGLERPAKPGKRPPARALGFDRDSILHAHVQAAEIGVDDLRPFFAAKLPATGTVNAQFDADGALHDLSGAGWVELDGGSLFGEAITRARAQGDLAGGRLHLTQINVSAAGGTVTANGMYDFGARTFQASAHGSGIALERMAWPQRLNMAVAGRVAISVAGSGTIDDPRLQGRASVSNLVFGGEPLGELDVTAHTANHALLYDAKTLLAGTELSIAGQTELRGDYATAGRMEFSRFDVGALLKMAHVDLSGESSMAGTVTLSGPLAHPERLRGEVTLRAMAMTLAGVRLVGEGGAHATLSDGLIRLDPVHITGEDTDLRAEGSMAIGGARRLDLSARGSVNLKLAETLDPDLTASGMTNFEVEAHGTVENPGLRGRIEFQNGSLSLEDVPNGLSQLRGALEFNQNRLEVRQLTAMSGGGLLSVGGYLSYQHGLYADLSVTGKGVRIRYPQGVSSLADANLRLQGTQTNLLLSGNVMITRFATSPDLDLAALAAQANASVQTVALPNAPSNHVRLDVRLTSSPQLNFQNAYAKLAGDVDLRLRGTLASPSVLGQVSITEGSAVIAGTRYDLQHGEVAFTNPVRIEPVIDLTATAHAEDYDITLGLHGPPQKLAVTYRSDPPLPEADVVSLLALGHTEDQERLYTQQQEQQLANPSTDALLGGALNATVSSRVQKLFGAGSVKVDPDYLGAFGNSTSRVTVQEQVGRGLTLTYATDVNTTSQQLLQAEVAINRHMSLVVARDESGVFSMVVKATRRYR